MKKKSQLPSGAFKALIAVGAWAGILIQCGVFDGRTDLSSLRYYTLLSNLLVAVYYSAAAVLTFCGNERPLPSFKGALIMGITVTGIVYHTLLSGGGFSMGSAQAIANQLLHTFTPVMCVLDWLLFDEKGRYAWRSPLKWTILPDVYFALATIYGFTSGDRFYGGARFPYFFIDYDIQGVWGVIKYVVILNLFFIALGYVFVIIDRLLRRKSEGTRVAARD